MSNSLDLDIANYSINDLVNLLGLSKNFTKEDVIRKSEEYINKYKNQKDNNLSRFFIKVQEKLLENLQGGLRQRNISHITESGRNIISREKLGLDETIPLQIGQDNLNQILRQTITRQIIIDSSFRVFANNSIDNNITSINNSSNFSVNLSENMKNVVSLKITGISIPDSIKVIDEFYGNDYFFIEAQKNSGPFGVYKNKDIFNIYDYSITRINVAEGKPSSPVLIANEINVLLQNSLPSSIQNDIFCLPSKPNEIVNNKIIFVNTGEYYIKITFWNKKIQQDGIIDVALYSETENGFIFKKYLNIKKTNTFINSTNSDNNIDESIGMYVNKLSDKNCGNNPTKNINLGKILGFRNYNNEKEENVINKKILQYSNDLNSIEVILNPNQFNNNWYKNNSDNNSNSGKIINPMYYAISLTSPELNLLNLDKEFWIDYPNPTQEEIDNRHESLKENWARNLFETAREDLKLNNISNFINKLNIITNSLNNYYAAYNIINQKEFNKKNIVYANVQSNFNSSNIYYVTVDDFQPSKEVSRTIAINTETNKLNLPSFKNKTNLEYEVNDNRTGEVDDYIDSLNNPNIAMICDEIPNSISAGNSMLLPSWPRTLTQNQIYAFNQIKNDRIKDSNKLNDNAPTFSDILGIFISGVKLEEKGERIVYKNISSSLVRNYFGPVEIDRLKIGLYDANGNLVNLNGLNWCLNLEAEELYQY